ncbi:putative cyclin-D6-1 [Gastrolobium bilobum]|uniref:putative cyclin-D6-1 n=1 Tax=Gastrolobium bilobum TaxID=150636 RepID=UPI002AB15D11|nr:putative cyclin-D6-1 [Gastrolobium bilobum]
MEFDLENPLAIFNEEESRNISELFESESDHILSPNSPSSTSFHVSFSREAISLIHKVKVRVHIVQLSCNLDPFVAYLAINYLHRFISRHEIPGKPWVLRLVVISCLSLASKMKNTPLSLSHNIQNKGFIFDARSIQKMELLILGVLKWRMRSITPFPFLRFFISLAEIKDQSLKQALKKRASEIIFNAHNDIKLSEHKPSTIAATALIYASNELIPHQYFILRGTITACEYLDEEAFSKCYELMQEMVRMEANESTIDTSFLSTETPMSVLERSSKR